MGDVTQLDANERRRETALANAHEPGGKRGSPRGRLSRAQFRHQVLTMLMSGATEQAIADALGCTKSRVSNVVNKTLETWETEDKKSIEQIRQLQLRRLDRMIQALWPDAIGVKAGPGGEAMSVPPSPKAIGEIRKLEALKARIAGTEAPKKIDLSGTVELTLPDDETERLDEAWAASGGEVIDSTADELAALPAGG